MLSQPYTNIFHPNILSPQALEKSISAGNIYPVLERILKPKSQKFLDPVLAKP